ncbi:MAG: ion transporter, partial [Myxococcota bacterium]
MSLKTRFKKVADAAWFQNAITFCILLAGIVVGIETYPSAVDAYGGVLEVINQIILWVFVAEIVVKVGSEGKRPWRYFFDPWNIFDFLIVAVCFLPIDAQYVAVLRLARLLRVLKLVRALPQLQILVSALLKSIPSMGYVALLLGILFYLYAVAAVFLFGANDPVHF